jgi:hypothetical protein
MKSLKQQRKEALALIGKVISLTDDQSIQFTVEEVVIMIGDGYYGDKQSALTGEEIAKNGFCVAVCGEGFGIPYDHKFVVVDEKNDSWDSENIYNKFEKIEKIEIIRDRYSNKKGVIETWGEIGDHRILIDSEKKS